MSQTQGPFPVWKPGPSEANRQEPDLQQAVDMEGGIRMANVDFEEQITKEV